MSSVVEAGTYYGHLEGSLDGSSAKLIETSYAPKAKNPLHSHVTPFLCIVARGAFDEQVGRKTTTHHSTHILFRPAGESHSERFYESGAVCLNVEFQMSSGAYDDIAWPDYGFAVRNDRINALGMHLYTEFCRAKATASPISDLVLHGLSLALAGEVVRVGNPVEGGAPPPYLARIKDLLHDRFREQLTMDDIAGEAMVHPAHLSRVFRAHFGCTVGEYVRRLRIEEAMIQLGTTHRPISAIAHDLGFADHSHLTRIFKHAVGYTPSGYRAVCR